GGLRNRKIPRRENGDYSHRLLDDEEILGGIDIRQNAAVDAFALFRIPFEPVGGVIDFATRLGKWLALLSRQIFGQALLVRADDLADIRKNRAAFLDAARTPGTEGTVRRLDRSPQILPRCDWECSERFLGGGVDDIDAAIPLLDPLARDAHLQDQTHSPLQ